MVVQIGLYHIMSLWLFIKVFIILCHYGCSDRSLSYYVTGYSYRSLSHYVTVVVQIGLYHRQKHNQIGIVCFTFRKIKFSKSLVFGVDCLFDISCI